MIYTFDCTLILSVCNISQTASHSLVESLYKRLQSSCFYDFKIEVMELLNVENVEQEIIGVREGNTILIELKSQI